MEELKRAVCCACHQQCGLKVHVSEGRITRISGDRAHPLSAGFVCRKGSHAHELHYHPARVHHPLKRAGPRGSGRWERIPWPQAIEEIACAIGSVTGDSGAEAFAYGFGTFHGADYGIGQRFTNLLGSPNAAGQDKICYGPIALGEALTYGYGPTFFTPPIPGTTRCMVVWGLRPSASMPLLWRGILEARRAGAKLIVIDPERTREVHMADLWLQPRPGTDAALALSLIHCIIEEGRYDRGFVEARTVGFADLRERAAAYRPATVSSVTQVPAAQISEAARMLTGNAPAIVHAGNGLCQSGRSTVDNGRALACLIAITGNLGVPGGHFLTGPPRDLVANGDAFSEAALPSAQRDKRLGAERFPVLGAGFDALDEAMGRAWYGQRRIMSWLSTAHEPTLWRAISDGDPYQVRALVLQHHNPVGASANAAAVARALKSPALELLVAHDLFLNATSHLADYVLPAAHWLEKPFLSMGLGLMGIAGDYVEAKQAAIAPEHEHRSDYDLWRDLGRQLGQHWPETIEELWQWCLEPAGLDLTALCERVGPAMGEPARRPVHDGGAAAGAGFGTPSGKVELSSSWLARWGADPLPSFDLADARTSDYPLVLTTGGRLIEGFHQDAQLMPSFRRKHPDPVVRMHPEAAAAAGVREGEWVWLETPVGRVRQRAHLTDELLPGMVHADRWWYPERGDDRDDPFGWRTTNVNVCTDDAPDACDPVFGSWQLRALPCRLEPEAIPRGPGARSTAASDEG